MTLHLPVDAFLREGALLKVRPGGFVAAWGPFAELAVCPRDAFAWYTNDFFLTDPRPWKCPAGWCEVNHCHPECNEGSPQILWKPLDRIPFEKIFYQIDELIRARELIKLVPVVFEEGTLTKNQSLLPRLLSRLGDVPKSVWPYGIWNETRGMVGATPEILCELEGRSLKTMSLAGTAPVRDANRLVSHAKEKREHGIVIEEMVDRLKAFGEVAMGAREIIEIGSLAHLKTSIDVRLRRETDSEDIIRALHPTPALGAVPRDDGMALLQELDRHQRRGRFGAPFGVVWPDGRARFVVAIRSLQWEGERVRIGAGCGLVAGSTLEREWEELQLKRESVKRMFAV